MLAQRMGACAGKESLASSRATIQVIVKPEIARMPTMINPIQNQDAGRQFREWACDGAIATDESADTGIVVSGADAAA